MKRSVVKKKSDKQREQKQARKKWRQEKLIHLFQEQQEAEKRAEDFKHNESISNETKAKSGRQHTLSIAVPSSIMDNAQCRELQTCLAGQIARAAAIFCVDEVVIYNDKCTRYFLPTNRSVQGLEEGHTESGIMMAKILQFLECPQYLRKHLFPIQKDFRYAGVLNPLAAPHHLRKDEYCSYREGVVCNRPTKEGEGSYVNVGLDENVQVNKTLPAGVRVTVELRNGKNDKLMGKVVAPSSPRTAAGLYWGYSVRLCKSLHSVFTQCPFPEGYDLTIGTSERGEVIDQLQFPAFKHCLVVFGSVQGLEDALECDEALSVSDPSLLFNYYVNTCPGQGSRTIRTEEALLISLARIKPKIEGMVTNH